MVHATPLHLFDKFGVAFAYEARVDLSAFGVSLDDRHAVGVVAYRSDFLVHLFVFTEEMLATE